ANSPSASRCNEERSVAAKAAMDWRCGSVRAKNGALPDGSAARHPLAQPSLLIAANAGALSWLCVLSLIVWQLMQPEETTSCAPLVGSPLAFSATSIDFPSRERRNAVKRVASKSLRR